jgi:acyl-CoA synthetase (AMP-forming)/AMP-acid ligase II
VSEITTLVEMLERRVLESPGQPAFVWEGEAHSFEGLGSNVGRLASHLRGLGVGRGDRVVLVLPNGPEFFFGFYGALTCGAVAVPVFPGSGPQRVLARARHCGAKVVVVPSDTPPALIQELQEAPAGPRVTTFSASAGAPSLVDRAAVDPDDVAMLQYTSGSTGEPKGVQLSHANLLTNVRQLIAGLQITQAEVFVSWLPVYHDMGLILKTMVPFYLGARLVLLPTNLTNVRTWLQAIQDHRGTFTAAPDFAYRLCLRSIRDAGAYDLTSLRVALDAAEPVRESTLVQFEKAFGLGHVMVAGYGLAEATVGVATWRPGTRPAVDERGLVSVGPPFPAIVVRIEDDRGRELAPGEIGSVLIKSPANSRGYWENPTATAQLLRADGYIDSGDLGSLDAAGNLYIAGRKKNIIITAGRNVSPKELEEISDMFPEVRYSAAIGVDKGGAEGEQAFVFAELRRPLPEGACRELVVAMVDKIHGHLGLRPARVYLVKPRTIPRTYNGKIQYPQLRARYLAGELRAEGLIVFPEY